MKGNASMNTTSGIFVPLALGLVIAGIVYATLTGKQLPLISSPRAALIALLIVGLAMCSFGIGQVGASGRWASPLAILGYLLGAAILVIILSAFTGWKLPMIAGETQAVVAVAILIAIKYLIGTASFIFHWL
jgi:hypothetical protein